MPRRGALSLLQKTPHYKGGPAETAARLNVKFWLLVPGSGDRLTGGGILPPFLSQSFVYTEIKSRRGAGRSRVIRGCWLCFCNLHLAARCPARVARCPKRAATKTIPGRAVVGPRRGFVPHAPTVQTCVSAGAPAAALRPPAQTRRRYVTARINLPLYICS